MGLIEIRDRNPREPLPSNVLLALRREEERADQLHVDVGNIIALQDPPEEKNKWIQAVIEGKIAHQRKREQIATEFGLPAKYVLAREGLARKDTTR